MTPFPRQRRTTKYPGVAKMVDGRYKVCLTWIDPHTGRRIYRTKLVGGTLDDAVKARAALRDQEPSGTRRSRPRFGDFARTWLEHNQARGQLSPSTLDRYTHDVAQLAVDFGAWWVDSMNYGALEQWQSERAPQYAPATINGWLRTLRLILDSARRDRLLTTNPARELQALKEARTRGARGTSLSAAEFRALLAAIPGCASAETERALTVLAWTGVRDGELLALRWEDDVDGELRIERSVWRGLEKTTKTDDPRRITQTGPVVEALAEQRRWLLATQHPGLKSGLIFPAAPMQARAGRSRRNAGEPTWYRSQSTIQAALTAACTSAGVPRVSPHGLRRTFEDLLREARVEQLVRRAVAGWRSERAQGIYATVSREDRDAAASAVVRLVMG